MTLAELMKECDYGTKFELHDSKDGRMVANTPKGLEKYKDIEIVGFRPHIKTEKYSTYARVEAVMFVWGAYCDIQDVKKREKEQKV